MAETSAPTPPAPPPHAQLVQMGIAYWVSRLLYAAAELRLADHLAKGPRSAAQLAETTGTHAPSLHRFMRSLASVGILSQDTEHRFALTPLGEALKTGAPGSALATILTLCGDHISRAWNQLPYSLKTGRPGFDKEFGAPIFDWLKEHPHEASLFGETMIGFHGAEPAAVAAAYAFPKAGTLVDVGGGTGNLLTTILAAHPGCRGILFDLPHVAADGNALVQQRGLADRVAVQSGSFFESVPAGGDFYLLSHVIHDWSEDLCLTILSNCRKAMKPESRLLIIEMVLPPGDAPHPGKLLDMMMLVGPGGQERTAEEYGALLAKAGFRLERVVPTESAVSVVEARRS